VFFCSEMASAAILAVSPEHARDLERHCARANIACTPIGRVTADGQVRIRVGRERVLHLPLNRWVPRWYRALEHHLAL